MWLTMKKEEQIYFKDKDVKSDRVLKLFFQKILENSEYLQLYSQQSKEVAVGRLIWVRRRDSNHVGKEKS